MNKTAEALEYLLEKQARILTVGDIEDSIGTYLSDAQEEVARARIEQEYAKSFALRNPIKTGLVSFGLAPYIAKHRALDDINKTMARNYTELTDKI